MADYKIICDECENEVPVNPNTLAEYTYNHEEDKE